MTATLTASPVRFAGEAACAGLDPEAFFPHVDTPHREVDKVRKICRTCPVKAACLSWAMDNREFGIWGGLTEHQRKRLRLKLYWAKRLAAMS